MSVRHGERLDRVHVASAYLHAERTGDARDKPNVLLDDSTSVVRSVLSG